MAGLGLGLALVGLGWLGLARVGLGLGLRLGFAGLGWGLRLEHASPIRWRRLPIRWRLCRSRRLVGVAAAHDLRTHACRSSGAVLLRRRLCLPHGPSRSLR